VVEYVVKSHYHILKHSQSTCGKMSVLLEKTSKKQFVFFSKNRVVTIKQLVEDWLP